MDKLQRTVILKKKKKEINFFTQKSIVSRTITDTSKAHLTSTFRWSSMFYSKDATQHV